MIGFAKWILYHTVYRVGKSRTVLLGPCRGLKYHIFSGYSLAYLYGGRERDEMQITIEHVTPGWVIYDLGANFGMHTLLLAWLAGPEGRALAFEPPPDVYRWLQQVSSALRGALRVLRRRPPTLLIELFTPEQDVAVGAILHDLGYTLERLRPMEKVEHLALGWPHKNGIWGTALAVAQQSPAA